MKYWLIASYKINEINRLITNLLNQKFNYYLPRIIVKKIDSGVKEEMLFPGYIFINTELENYSNLRFTRGIKNVIKFGNNIPCMTDDEIESIKIIENASKIDPITSRIYIGQEATIARGFLKGLTVKICSLPSKNRIDILLHILGGKKRVNVSEKDLLF